MADIEENCRHQEETEEHWSRHGASISLSDESLITRLGDNGRRKLKAWLNYIFSSASFNYFFAVASRYVFTTPTWKVMAVINDVYILNLTLSAERKFGTDSHKNLIYRRLSISVFQTKKGDAPDRQV